eukprot:CAMPEP_0115143896 /NCGR_PEP_ID=MMETSP0227-20121206/61054_1 /TAXON_ID=89957 /ORGANISM="Polarella glacialis, Strain CCMP 1383" /LENGTH=383 /DNA_ID=CAMNT_0002552833 /DNA_START=57 /DNA_END=1208 /DNA_ORIENTATION=-
MGKRAASKPLVSPAKSPKKTTPKEEAQVEEDNTFAEPILELISQASSLSDGCREMLLAMSPHCLKTTKSDRHAYQHQMVEVLTKVVVEVQAENASAVRAAEAEVNEMESQQASAAGGTTAAQQAVQHATEERDTRQAAMSSADQVTKVADQALADARNSVANLETERAGMVADKAEYESLIAETWAQLKAGEFPGQRWRERAKLTIEVVEMLKRIGLDASLEGGLPVALKAKPSERGPFAEKVVAYSEGLLTKHVVAVEAKLGGMEVEAGNRGKAVEDAEVTLAASVQAKEHAQESLAAAGAELAQKEKELAAAKKAEKALEPSSKKLSATLEEAKEKLEAIQALAAKFQLLCEKEAEPAEPVLPAMEPMGSDEAQTAAESAS